MKRILRIGRGVKVRRATVKEIMDLPAMDVDARTELIQALIPLGLWHVDSSCWDPKNTAAPGFN